MDARLHLTRQFWMLISSLILPGNDADGYLQATLHLGVDLLTMQIRTQMENMAR